MTTRVRIGLSVLALSLVGLFAGCSSQPRQVRHSQPANDFEIVETSTKRQLSVREMAYLRAKVADYLTQQGETGSGDYYVKIYLGEEAGVVEQGEWVVVRYTRYPSATTYYVASDLPAYGYPAYGYSTFDYFPFGWLGFGAFSFRAYDDPYYRGYYPYQTRYGHTHRVGGYWRDRDRRDHRRHDHDKKHDRDRDDDKKRGDVRPRLPGSHKPTFIPANVRRGHENDVPFTSFDHRRRDDGNGRVQPGVGTPTRRWERRNDAGSSGGTRGTGFAPNRTVAPRDTGEAGTYQRRVRNNPDRPRAPGSYTRPVDTGIAPAPRNPEPRERSYNPAPRAERAERSGGAEWRGRDSSRPEPAPRPESANSYERSSERTNSNPSGRVHDRGGRGAGGRRGDLEP